MEIFLSLIQNPYFIQGFGLVGTILALVGMQSKSYSRLAACKIGNEVIDGIHYLLLGQFDGAIVNFVSCTTNPVYWHRIKRGKSTLPFQIAFGLLFVSIVLWQWNGWINIFILVAKLLSSVALGINSVRVIRILNLISSGCWLLYSFYVGSVAGILTNVLLLISLISAIVRIDIRERRIASRALRAPA